MLSLSISVGRSGTNHILNIMQKHNTSIIREDFGPLFYKFKRVPKISTNRIKIFGKTTMECLLSNEYRFMGLNNLLNIFASV